MGVILIIHCFFQTLPKNVSFDFMKSSRVTCFGQDKEAHESERRVGEVPGTISNQKAHAWVVWVGFNSPRTYSYG